MYDEATINYKVYENGSEYIGISQCTLPNLTAMTLTISGAGIAGNVETIIPGHFDAMSMTMNFHNITEQTMKLSEPRRHNIDLRAPIQDEDPVSGTLKVRQVKHILIVIPKTENGGTIQQASPADGSMEFSVRYWATYMDGKKVREVDPFNFIYYLNGKDYLAETRTALGC